MTTNRDIGASAPSADGRGGQPAGAAASPLSALFTSLGKCAERLLASQAAFPLLLALFLLDRFLPSQQVLLLLGLLAISGLCAEEYVSFLRAKGLRAPLSLGFNASVLPPLVAFCWRLPAQPGISLGLLTIITLALVFCTLMVTLALIGEVSEKMAQGLGVFVLACGGSLLIGLAFAHLLLLRQVAPAHLTPPLVVLALGWLGFLLAGFRLLSLPSLPLLSRYTALGLASIVAFWSLRLF